MKVFVLQDIGPPPSGYYYKGGDDSFIDFTGSVSKACFWLNYDSATATCSHLNRRKDNVYTVLEIELNKALQDKPSWII